MSLRSVQLFRFDSEGKLIGNSRVPDGIVWDAGSRVQARSRVWPTNSVSGLSEIYHPRGKPSISSPAETVTGYLRLEIEKFESAAL